jgi:hypothetical protein
MIAELVIASMSVQRPLGLLTLLAASVLCSTFDKPLPDAARRDGDPGITSCQSWLNILDSCTVATTSFTDHPFSVQASCLCYSVCSWQPKVFDNAWGTCLAHISTASPGLYSSIGGKTLSRDPCQEVGNVVVTGTGTCGTATGFASPPLTTGPTKTRTGHPAGTSDCVSWEVIVASCELETPSFTNLPVSQEASCLCYTNRTFAPTIFDGYWGSCLAFLSTASPKYYSSVGGDGQPRTPCAEYGDVRATGPRDTIVTSSSTATPNPAALTTFVSITAIAAARAARLTIDWRVWLFFVGPYLFLI